MVFKVFFPHGLKILPMRTNDIPSARCTAISCSCDANKLLPSNRRVDCRSPPTS